jgi:hypothetical protein
MSTTTGVNMVVPVTVFLRFLAQLAIILDKVEAFDPGIATHRLQPDMLPLLQQAKTAIGFTLRACCPLAGRPIVSFTDDAYSFASVRRELRAAQDYLAAMPDADFAAIDAVRVDTRAGFADLNLSGWEYYLTYALPNFFFHYTTVYAIARQAGVPLGKADFDGYHQYPAGFSFTAPA